MTQIDGPRFEPQSGDVQQLIIFTHGYGSDGNDLIGLAEAFAPHLPDTAFVSPHAPFPCDMSPMGRQWFPLTLRDPNEYWQGAVSASPYLNDFIDREKDHYDLQDDAVALVGFSQGTMMALHTGLMRPDPLAAIIGFSGLLPMQDPEGDAHVVSRPPVMLIHGDMDEVVPVEATHTAYGKLKQAGVPTNCHISPGMGHGIAQDGIQMALECLINHLPSA